MITSEVMEQVRDLLKADTTLLNWCQANYSKGPSIFMGYNLADPPGESYHPLITIGVSDHLRGIVNPQIQWVLQLGFGLWDESAVTEASEVVGGVTVKTYTYPPAILLERFRELGENAVFNNMGTANLNLGKIDFPETEFERLIIPPGYYVKRPLSIIGMKSSSRDIE